MTNHTSISSWLILAAVLIGTFVGTLGNSMTNVAVPSLMSEFAVPLDSAVWVVILYTLLLAVLMPVCGYLGDLYGQRRLYLVGMALFTVATLGNALAPTFPWLLGSRALQGIGIAPTLPAIMAIIARTFSPRQRGQAIGFWALVNGAAHSAGPPVSGFLVQHLGWRAVFLSTLPLCVINLIVVWWLVPDDERRSARRFDFGGAATLTLSALGLTLALTQSGRWGWGSLPSLGLWGATLLAFILFVRLERRITPPFVELALFANRAYTAATAVIAAQLFCLFGLLLALPVFLIQAQGWGDQKAGLMILPLPLTMAAMAPLAGRLADEVGSRLSCGIGMALVALGALVMLLVWPGAGQPFPPWLLVGGLVLIGMGMGLTQSPAAAAVTQVVEQRRLGVATGIFHMGRFTSGSLGSATFGLILQSAGTSIGLGFQRNLMVVLGLALAAALASQGLPGRQVATLARETQRVQ